MFGFLKKLFGNKKSNEKQDEVLKVVEEDLKEEYSKYSIYKVELGALLFIEQSDDLLEYLIRPKKEGFVLFNEDKSVLVYKYRYPRKGYFGRLVKITENVKVNIYNDLESEDDSFVEIRKLGNKEELSFHLKKLNSESNLSQF